MKEQYEKKINLEKEFIDAQPINNIKNINKKQEVISKIKTDYINQAKKIKIKLKNFISKYDDISIDPNIEKLEKRIKEYQKNIDLLNEFNTSFEKMGLDKICLNIRNYKENNLEFVNKNILDAIQIFNKVGIELEKKDFEYSIYSYKYICELLNNNDITNLNTLFEQLYWQNPNIIKQIEMNFRFLYLKNKIKFDKYIFNLQKSNSTKLENVKNYKQEKIKYIETIEHDTYLTIEKFKNKKLRTTDYSEEKIVKLKNEISDGESEEINYKNFLEDVIEYKQYKKFKFLLEEIKVIFSEKLKYKNAYKLKLKEIIKNEKKLFSLNKKYKKTLNEELKLKINSILDTLYELYVELEEAQFNEMIQNKLFDNSSIENALEIASSYYIFIFKSIKKHQLDLNIDEMIMELKDYVIDPANSIINRVNIIENNDFNILISEKNRLMHMLIEPSMLDDDNINNLIEKLTIIKNSYNLKKTKISLDEIDTVINVINVLSNDKNIA